MLDEIISLQEKILTAISAAADADALEVVRIQYLARSGALPLLLEKMASVPKEQRPIVGKAANEAKNAVAVAYEARKARLQARGSSRLTWGARIHGCLCECYRRRRASTQPAKVASCSA